MNRHEKDLLAALVAQTAKNSTEIKKIQAALKADGEALEKLIQEHNAESNK